MRKQLGAILLVGAVALTTACSSGAAAANNATDTAPAISANGAQQVTLKVGNNMSFAPSTITVRAGQTVELTLRNEGFLPHDFTLTEGVAEPVKIAGGGGQTTSGTFTIDTPGAYTFVCTVPGHESAGMKGTIMAQ
jgi:nitrite reductase (NO-forming)